MPRWLSWWFRRPSPSVPTYQRRAMREGHKYATYARRGRQAAFDLPHGGSDKPTAYTDTKPSTGTSAATKLRAVECSSSSVRGVEQVDTVTLPQHLRVNSYFVLTSFGPGTAARGVSGAPPPPAA